MVLRRSLLVGLLLAGLSGAPVARADNYPVIVVPGKRGVPVIINGRDASWSIVEGDWGLYRPGAVPVTVISPRPWVVLPYAAPPPYRYVRHHRYHRSRRHVVVPRRAPKAVVRRPAIPATPAYIPPSQRHYFPGGAAPPRLGRLEVEPKGPPKPAETFFRSWGTESPNLPATIPSSAPVVVAPIVTPRVPVKPKP
jgi:hypothetical protein